MAVVAWSREVGLRPGVAVDAALTIIVRVPDAALADPVVRRGREGVGGAAVGGARRRVRRRVEGREV